ncbi:MAG: hypothetical protein IKT32_02445 [Clostridia bacterium]|nr:hypothetical protein [Clostridia bacterium]
MKITKNRVYTAQTNAAGDTVADYINTKRVIEVGIIPLDADVMASLQNDLDNFNVTISCRNPQTNALEDNINCIIPTNGVDYYTIRVDKVMYKAFVLVFQEL